MRRILSITLSFALLLICFSSCSTNKNVAKPINFYYLSNPESYNESTVCAEVRSGAGFEEDLTGLFQQYLKGPQTDDLVSPFPKRVSVKDAKIRGITVHITVSSELVQLAGLDMTLATACLAMTALEYTGMQRVSITATDAKDSILYTNSLTQADILLIDD